MRKRNKGLTFPIERTNVPPSFMTHVMIYGGPRGQRARVPFLWWFEWSKLKKAKKKCPPIPWGNCGGRGRMVVSS